MDHRNSIRPGWGWLGASALGGVLVLLFWTAWLGFAANESVGPQNGSSVRFLVGLVVGQAVVATIYLLLIARWHRQRHALITFLPWLLWGLVVLNVGLLSKSGFY